MRREELTVLFGIGVLVMGAGCVTPKDRVSGNAGAASPEPGTRVSLEQKSLEDHSSARFFSHTVNNGKVTITKYTGPGGIVIIPSAVNGIPVRNIGNWAFGKCAGLTGVKIPDGVTTIGKFAFANCNGLTGVTIPASVTSIEASAFVDCHGLTSVIVHPANPTYCCSAEGVMFNKERTRIVLYPAGKAGSYVIPNGVIDIGNSAFASCTGLTSVIFSDGITTIGEWAFCNCSSLTGVMFPDGVTSIGTAAFYCCNGLKDVMLPASVSSMSANPFRGCNSLTSIRVNPANPAYCSSADGVVFNKEKASLVSYPAGKTGNYDIPGSVTHIGASAFQGSNLTSVTVPSSVTAIGMLAFKWCHSLAGVYFKGNVPSHGGRAFEGTTTPIIYYRPGTTGWGTEFGGRPTAEWTE